LFQKFTAGNRKVSKKVKCAQRPPANLISHSAFSFSKFSRPDVPCISKLPWLEHIQKSKVMVMVSQIGFIDCMRLWSS
jgi:hypothetical protein